MLLSHSRCVAVSDELTAFLIGELDMPNHDGEWNTFLDRYNLTGARVRFEVFQSRRIDLGQYVTWLTGTKPHLRQRFSNQAWLNYRLDATRVLRERAGEQELVLTYY